MIEFRGYFEDNSDYYKPRKCSKCNESYPGDQIKLDGVCNTCHWREENNSNNKKK